MPRFVLLILRCFKQGKIITDFLMDLSMRRVLICSQDLGEIDNANVCVYVCVLRGGGGRGCWEKGRVGSLRARPGVADLNTTFVPCKRYRRRAMYSLQYMNVYFFKKCV